MKLHVCVAELVATFAMVFVGTGAIVVNDLSHGAITHLGVSLSFGMIITVMIYAVGDVSGAHMNPAVTLGFWIARRLDGAKLLPYILSQLLGAVLGSLLVWVIFGKHANLGATLPSGSVVQSFGLEVVLSFLLMFTILQVTTGAKEKGIMAGLAIGAVVGVEALFGGPISGASMNPARSLGPAVLSGQLQHLWIYLVAPPIGAGLAVVGYRFSRD